MTITPRKKRRKKQYRAVGRHIAMTYRYPTFFFFLLFICFLLTRIEKYLTKICQRVANLLQKRQMTYKMKNLQKLSHHLHFYEILCPKITIILFLLTHFCCIHVSNREVGTTRLQLQSSFPTQVSHPSSIQLCNHTPGVIDRSIH